jgi:hypothetical protein
VLILERAILRKTVYLMRNSMKKTGLLMMLSLGLFWAGGNQTAMAQSDTPKWEVGGQFSGLKLDYKFRGTESAQVIADDVWWGVGGRVTFNFNKNVAIEGTIEKFNSGKTNRALNTSGTFNTAAKPDVQGLFGIKFGVRREKYGVFGKLRPGFTKFTPVPDCTAIGGNTCSFNSETSFSVDAGGVVEGYISRRLVVRGDAGVVYMRHRDTTLFFPGEPGIPAFLFTSQGFKVYSPKFSVGAGFRF